VADELERSCCRGGSRGGRTTLRSTPVVSADGVQAMQASLEDVEIDRQLREYAVALVQATRKDGAARGRREPARFARAAQARACARRHRRAATFVTPDDVRDIAVPALSHRVVLRAEVWAEAWARRMSRPTRWCARSVDRYRARAELAVNACAAASSQRRRPCPARDARLIPYCCIAHLRAGRSARGRAPALAALAAPFIIALALGLAADGPRARDRAPDTRRDQVLEGDVVTGRLALTWDGDLDARCCCTG
jgi:hypothetical protein